MARITQDREDLLREATAFNPRVMLRMLIADIECDVFAGFRGDALSLYFCAAPVYHFNGARELRRAFCDDQLIKAERGQLIRARRQRSDAATILASTPLASAEYARFAAQLMARLAALRANLERGTFELVGQEPANGDCVPRLQAWLGAWSKLKIAAVANVS